MTKATRCECRVCKLLLAIEPLRDKATMAERIALNKILVDWEAKSNDAAYWEMKFKRTWPEHDA